ncbi:MULTISPECIES: hypothetical protein [unclassified Acetobacterium]|uniref:hypothetical protein n=1 Tax=unclassified Acetobacterium TaxID=2638182 RepID=UPI000DBECC4A|nr:MULTISPECIES: hypothetical protein [unclassified Acetobacterium]AWW25893.1 hypothetical protein DOZ58_04085 [Acetobacterium sp. KB-1]MDZ5726793.1 hypothetical protein [Acetobacterium sp. K1/6]
MKNKQSVFIKILLLIGVPVVVVFLLMAETGINLLKKINLSSAQFTTIQNSIILVFVIGLIIVLAIIMIIAKRISIRVTRIENITNYIASRDVKLILNEQIKNSNDQLNGIIIALVNIAKIMQKRTIEVEKIALWDDFSLYRN